jgi:hypothetical protein
MAHKKILIPASLLVVFVASLFGAVLLTPESRSPILFDIPEISLVGYQRLMIFAPHCDDEILGSAGLIQKAHQLGIDVRVVLETNGDGYLLPPWKNFGASTPAQAILSAWAIFVSKRH